MDSKLASRKLGYGFSTQHQEISLTDFVVNAKKELEAVPVFDPWRHIAVEKKVKRFLDNESQTDAANSEKSYSKEYKKTLQKYLQEAGFYSSKIDGDFGKGTRAAIIDWQKSIKKNETGYLTKKQIKALNQTYGGFLGYGYPREMQNLHSL